MRRIDLTLPENETEILWRYFDGVSTALSLRFDDGSPPAEENLTFLLCELLDEGRTSRHLLEYSLAKAKEDLAKSDGGLILDVSFQTHPHTKPFESKYSGADLGLVFGVDHPFFGRFEQAVLLQAKRLAPGSTKGFSLNSPFDNFDFDQRDFLIELERRFRASTPFFISGTRPPLRRSPRRMRKRFARWKRSGRIIAKLFSSSETPKSGLCTFSPVDSHPTIRIGARVSQRRALAIWTWWRT